MFRCIVIVVLLAGKLLAQGGMTNGENHSAAISVSGEIDTWTFTANAGDAISVSVGEVSGTANFWPWIRLQAPNSTSLGSSFSSTVVQISTIAAATGTYTVLVGSYTSGNDTTGTGQYGLTLAKRPGAFVVPAGDDGGPMTNGANHTGSIHVGDLDQWTVAASAGDAISVSVGEVTGTANFWPWIRLHSPDGTLLGSSFSSTVVQVDATAAATGTYTVVVGTYTSGNDISGTGDYRLTLAKRPGAFVVPAGDDGGPMTNGANHTGSIHVGDLDQWSFTANAGDAISLSMGEVTGTANFWPWIRLHSPDGTLLGSSFSSTVVQIDATAAATGTYTVVVGTYTSGNDISGTGDYRLTLAKRPGAFVVPVGDDGGAMTNGANHTGSIHVGDLDQWSFTANAGDAISLSMGEVTGTANFWPWIRLHSPDGTLLGSSFSSTVVQIDATAAATGTYTVVVGTYTSGNDISGTGDYRLTLAKRPGAFVVPVGDDGGAMTNGANHTGSIHVGDLDQWSFTANAGDAISLSMGEVTGTANFWPWIRLQAPDGALLGSSFSSSVAQVDSTAPATGTYTVVVGTYTSGNDISGTGDYRLTLAKRPGTFIVPTGDEGGALAIGANSGAIFLGDLDQWTLQANAGETIMLSVTEVAGDTSFWPWIRLQAPNGALLGSSFGNTTAQISATATATGTYTVVAGTYTSGNDISGTGNYQLISSHSGVVQPPTLDPPSSPNPGNGATGVSRSVTLSWIQGQIIDSMDVYFGTSSTPPLATNTTVRSYTPSGLTASTTYYWRVVAKLGSATASSPVWSFTTAADTPTTTGLRFVPVTPCRLVDTREASLGAFGTPALVAGASRDFVIPQKTSCGIPASAAAYSINLTVVPKGPLSYVTIWPAGAAQPLVSTLNSIDGRIKANAALVPAGANGAISVFATNATELVLDINGYFIDPAVNPQALAFYPLTPCRILDTRNPNGSLGGPVIPGGSRDIPILSSNCGVPASAQAYSVNATVVPSGPLSYLTLWPTGQPQPLVSTLNALTGGIVANAALVPAGTSGSISAFVTSTSHLVLDINGYFAPPGAANAQRFFAVTPCRLLDTRNPDGEFGGPVLAAGSARSYRLPLASCGLPATATAYSLNATVVPASLLSYLTLWPFGTAQPLVSTLNALDDTIVANAAIVPAGTGGAVASFVTNQTHLILDTNGFFAP